MDDKEKEALTVLFKEKIWPLNQRGSYEHGVKEFIRACNQITYDQKRVTFALIHKKYSDYLKYMNSINSERESQYQSKVETIITFLMEKRYNEDFFINTNDSLDKYMYGN